METSPNLSSPVFIVGLRPVFGGVIQPLSFSDSLETIATEFSWLQFPALSFVFSSRLFFSAMCRGDCVEVAATSTRVSF